MVHSGYMIVVRLPIFTSEPSLEKTIKFCYRPGPTQTNLYSHRRKLYLCNFGIKKKRDCTIPVVEAKALISCTVKSQLVCTFGFAYTNCWFSDTAAQILRFSALSNAEKYNYNFE